MSQTQKQQQPYTRNNNVLPDGHELYNVANGWKKSGSGNIYTAFDELKFSEIPSEFLLKLKEQCSGQLKESVGLGNYNFVISYTDQGRVLLYAYEDSTIADKKASYIKVPDSVPTQSQQQLVTTQTSTTPASTVQKPTTTLTSTNKTIQVVKDVRPIAWDNAMEIEKAEQEGLYVLPIIHVGNNRFFFENNNGEFCLLYGRIINVGITDN